MGSHSERPWSSRLEAGATVVLAVAALVLAALAVTERISGRQGRAQAGLVAEGREVEGWAELAEPGAWRGEADAAVTVVEFSDFQCPFCRMLSGRMDSLIAAYPGRVRHVFRHLPLEAIHPQARAAAVAAECAEEQGRFWPYHDLLFAEAAEVKAGGYDFAGRFETLPGGDAAAFAACVAEGRPVERIEADMRAAAGLGIRGTPGILVNEMLVGGAVPLDSLRRLVEQGLARAGR
ncbi:MAG: DsbA family protein [Gemmatimonadota bacterium]|nr:DsbA family protein [Gemmatimonadota bacterium]